MFQRAARYGSWLMRAKPTHAPEGVSVETDTARPDGTNPSSGKEVLPVSPEDTDAPSPGRNQRINSLAKAASRLGYEVVDVAGFLEVLRDRSDGQIATLNEALETSKLVVHANEAVTDRAASVTKAADSTLQLVDSSVEAVRASANRSNDVAGWVSSISGQVLGVKSSLTRVETNTRLIEDIAFQVDVLSINARIEASRAGEAGKGFAVIAHAINELSARTNEAAKEISSSVRSLNEVIADLAEQSESVRGNAELVISESRETDASLSHISDQIRSVHDTAQQIGTEAGHVDDATATFLPAFRNVGDSVTDTSKRIQGAMERVNALIDKTEEIVQMSTSLGGRIADARFIERVQDDANSLSAALEVAIRKGDITEAALFSRSYTPIPNSNPEQVMAPFTKLTDKLFTEVQEKALTISDKAVFCAAVNRDGYLPTHNVKFSKPQGRDPEWNMGNCRNRRIFNDRVGLKSGRNTQPFLLQVYRRDMGGGTFKLMKDVSAPITVNNRHWGGLRLAFDV